MDASFKILIVVVVVPYAIQQVRTIFIVDGIDIARSQIDRFVYRNGAVGGIVGRNIAGLRHA